MVKIKYHRKDRRAIKPSGKEGWCWYCQDFSGQLHRLKFYKLLSSEISPGGSLGVRGRCFSVPTNFKCPHHLRFTDCLQLYSQTKYIHRFLPPSKKFSGKNEPFKMTLGPPEIHIEVSLILEWNANANFFLWSLSLLNVNIKSDYLWTNQKRSRFSFPPIRSEPL